MISLMKITAFGGSFPDLGIDLFAWFYDEWNHAKINKL